MMDLIKVTIKTAIANFLVGMAKILVGYFGKSMAEEKELKAQISDIKDVVLPLELSSRGEKKCRE